LTEVLVSAVLLALWLSLGLQGWQRAMAQASVARSVRGGALVLQRQLGRDEGVVRRHARLVGIPCDQPEQRLLRLQQLAEAVMVQAPLALADGWRLDRWVGVAADELVLRWRLEPAGLERQRHLRLEGLGACALTAEAP
jgi:hypothetical protein